MVHGVNGAVIQPVLRLVMREARQDREHALFRVMCLMVMTVPALQTKPPNARRLSVLVNYWLFCICRPLA